MDVIIYAPNSWTVAHPDYKYQMENPTCTHEA